MKSNLLFLLLSFFWVAAVCIHESHAYQNDYEFCFQQASIRYGVDEKLLKAIALVESGMNPSAVHVNTDGSSDLGLMQINSRWLSILRQYGISERDLFDPCVSIHVGAWILAQNIERHGPVWRAVGAYNAASEWKRVQYVGKVAKALKRVTSQMEVNGFDLMSAREIQKERRTKANGSSGDSSAKGRSRSHSKRAGKLHIYIAR